MEEVAPEVYQNNFQKIFDWFHNNVHVGSEQFRYDIISLPHTHLKMVDIVKKIYFHPMIFNFPRLIVCYENRSFDSNNFLVRYFSSIMK